MHRHMGRQKDTQRWIRRQHVNIISLFSFLQNKESKLKFRICLYASSFVLSIAKSAENLIASNDMGY
jgi:hypothetical protein